VPELYHSLLNATIEHLESLKKQGVRYIPVSSDTLGQLQVPHSCSEPVSTPPPARKINLRSTRPAPAPVTQAKAASVPPISSSEPQAPFPVRTPLSREAKESAIAALRTRVLACVKCPHLVAVRHNVVFGVGDIHSPLMFVGEAPGADEDIKGEPFVGAAGQLLTKIIAAMGFSRQTVYIGNILKCRPDTPGQSSGNRKPTPEEMKICLPYILEQIEIIQPKVLVALGATAIEGLLGKKEGIGRLRGHFLDFRGIPLMPTFHPAYLLRNQVITEKRKVWEDMLQVMEKLGVPISEKQQGYFLRKSS